VAIPDYRVYPDVRFPAFVDDAARAVARVLEREGRGRAVYLAGHSAGAHIAALLANDPRYLERAGVDAARIDGFVGLSGPYDFLPIESGYLLEVFPEATRVESQPIRFAGSRSPATLLIHGADDGVVEPGNSERLAGRLEAAGVPVQLRIYDGAGHVAVAAALAPRLQFVADTLDDVASWIQAREAGASMAFATGG
jgi:acetyl esterase/lipase